MERWNPNLYIIEGRENNYSEEYLQQLVSVGRVLNNKRLPVIFSLSQLANLSRTLYSDLHAYVSRSDIHSSDNTYRSFTIKKRSGGKRWISIPCSPLMAVQKLIAQEVLNNLKPHPAAMAYVSGMPNPLKDHAKKHIGAKWILKLDIKNFFSNISEQQVYRVFYDVGYPKLLSFEMARLCTRVTPKRMGKRWNNIIRNEYVGRYAYDKMGSLPQGAPTSPALSNLVCIALDTELEALADSQGVTYSRYADDLCFSFCEASRQEVISFKKEVRSILWGYKFEVNSDKTRIIPPGCRQIITGVVIDSGSTTIPKELRNRIRMHLYYSKKIGIPKHCEEKGFRSVIGFRNHLYGLISYVCSINPSQGRKFNEAFLELPWLNFRI
jgi:RNA-directed DNA polymerase